MLPLSRATSSTSRVTPANDPAAQNRLSGSLQGVGNSDRAMEKLDVVRPAPINPDNPPPVLLRDPSWGASKPDFLSQSSLDLEWDALVTWLKTQHLSEKEVLALLRSGILQTVTGKAVADLIADAMLRSVQPKGGLSGQRLKEIVNVICHLPPSQWQAALGETLGVVGGQTHKGVKGFIHAQLQHSNAVRDEKIANNELLSDHHWDVLKALVAEGRTYIRPSDGELHAALKILEDAKDCRPMPKAAHGELLAFIDFLEQKDVARVRWPDHYVVRVKTLCGEIEPNADAGHDWRDVLPVTSWLEWVFGRTNASTDSEDASSKGTRAAPSNDDIPPLLSTLLAFERSADFFKHVNTNDLKNADNLAGKLVLAFNWLNLLQTDIRPIAARPGPVSSGEAWKNGPSDFTASPFEQAAGPSRTPSHADPLSALTQFIAKADEVFTRNLVPWDSARAQDPVDVKVEMEDLLRQVYQPAGEVLNDQPPIVEIVREQVQGLLQRMVGSLVSSGAAAWSSLGDLVERNPGRTVGAFLIYGAVNELYERWFAPEASLPDTFAEQSTDVYGVTNTASDIRENILDDLAFMLEELPELALELEERVGHSTYVEPHLDLQLLEDVDVLLRQPTADDPNVNYFERIEEIIQLRELDEEEQDEVHPFAGAKSEPLAAFQPLLRNTRSVAKETLDKLVVTKPARASHWVVEWARENLMGLSTRDKAAGEIAPGITVETATDTVIDVLKAAEAIVDPLTFIQNSMDTIISESSLSDSWKRTLNSTSTVEVRFEESYLPGRLIPTPPRRERVVTFTLAELCTDYHTRVKAANEKLTIQWPSHFPESLKNTILNADLQAAYKESVKSTLERTDVKELWKLSKEYELKSALESYGNANTSSPEGIGIANAFLGAKIKPQIIYLNNPRDNTSAKVSNAVYLGNPDGFGLFVFLGGDNAVIELPAGGTQRRDAIKTNKQLQGKLLDRIPLYEKLTREKGDFKFSKPAVGIFDFYPRYAPVLFDTTVDAMGELYKRQLSQVLSDIDTLVSTDEERFSDGLVAAVGKLLTAMSIVTIVPGATVLATKGARMAVSFLFGASASSTELIRGGMSDDPKVAAVFEANAYRGFIMEFAGPLAGKLLGKVFSKSIDRRIASSVFNRIKSMFHKLPKPIKWIAPVVKSPSSLIAKMELKFKNYRTVSQLQNLHKGPEFAQKLIKDTKVVYFSGPTEGYVYQGFVMRGDMRPPQVVFEKGFKLRTPISDVNQVNGMRGGFGGGKDALDMDGMGISTSAFYKKSGAGAYQYGGGRGGYTYVVDARQMRGYHLYANDHWKKKPSSTLGMRPYEVNYAQDIPATAVIGCYDKHGKFFPNPASLKNSIEASKPFQHDYGIFYRPAKSLIPSKNATLVPHWPF